MLKYYQFSFILTAILFSSSIFSQTPCVNGFATVSGGETFPCNDYDLMSNIPISVLANSNGNPEGSDIWGWTDPLDGKEYAIFATTNSTAFIDISDPVNPIFLGRIDSETSTSFWRDVKVYNNYAFIVADNVGAHGMQIFDLTRLKNITNPPVTLTTDAHYTGFGSAHNIVINEDSGYAYAVGTSRSGTYNGGPLFINIQNPLNPIAEGGFFGYSHDAQVVTYNGPDTDYSGREILISSSENEVVIIDVTNKNNPTQVSTISYNNIGYTHQGWFTDDHRYFILGDETDEQTYGMNTRTLTFDLSDLDNPVLFSTYTGNSMAIDHNGYVKDNSFFMANYRAGMRVLDIPSLLSASNTTAAIAEIGYFDTYPANDNTNYNGAWSVYPYFSSGNIIIGDIDRGLFIVRKSGTLSTTSHQLGSDFQLAPNPAKNNSTITSKGNQVINSIEIYTILGAKIFEANKINLLKFVLPIENYRKGIYLIKINSQITKKLLLK